MASLRHIGTIESDQEIEDFESDESVQEEEKVQWYLLLYMLREKLAFCVICLYIERSYFCLSHEVCDVY